MAVELRPIEEGDFAPLAVIAAEDAVERWWGLNDETSLREVAQRHQDRGAGAEALRLAMGWAFERGHHRAVIYPAAENARAIRCYEKVGFKPVGIFRRADRGRDSLGMDLLKEELT